MGLQVLEPHNDGPLGKGLLVAVHNGGSMETARPKALPSEPRGGGILPCG